MDEAAPAGRPGLTKFIRRNVKTFGDRYVRKSRFIVRPLNHIRRHSLEQTITLVLAGNKNDLRYLTGVPSLVIFPVAILAKEAAAASFSLSKPGKCRSTI